jgi:hypothetical protein
MEYFIPANEKLLMNLILNLETDTKTKKEKYGQSTSNND